MNREIIFRGKDGKGRWIEGYFCPCSFGRFPCKSAIISAEQMEQGAWEPVKVDPDTVGQYTGLTDYNGQPIYEDDIVEIQIGDLQKGGVVIYSDHAARWGIMETDGNLNFSFLQQPLVKQYSIKVVGNKHDWEYAQE